MSILSLNKAISSSDSQLLGSFIDILSSKIKNFELVLPKTILDYDLVVENSKTIDILPNLQGKNNENSQTSSIRDPLTDQPNLSGYLNLIDILISKKSVFKPTPRKLENSRIQFNEEPFASGGFAHINLGTYQDESENTQQIVIKFIKENREKNQKLINREIKRMTQLRFNYISNFLGYVEIKGKKGLVIQYYQKGSLSSLIKSKSFEDFSLAEKLSICYKITKAIEFIHLKGLCHFDIKPGNILLDSEYNPVISDFGTCQKPKIGYKDNIAYTLLYAPPEQLRGRPVKNSDIWNLAMTVYTVLSGISPFKSLKKEDEKIEKFRMLEILEIEKQLPDYEGLENISSDLKEILKRSWDLDPANRPAIKEFRKILGQECEKNNINPEKYVRRD